MPLDSVTQAPPSENWGLNRAQGWKLKLCWGPRKCFISSKPLWGKRAYVAETYINNLGDPVIETYWVDKHEFLLWQLKR